LIERPLRADIALLSTRAADALCHLTFPGEIAELAPLMAQAAEWVIAEAETGVSPATLPRSAVQTSGVLVHYLVRPAA
jgi:acetate CoA/acetoacetate CoA-transferase alpha subunit